MENVWFIDGVGYDMRTFVHPGGDVALGLGRGRDCSTLFHTYHPNTEALKPLLKKYLVHDNKSPTTLSSGGQHDDDPFYAEVKSMVTRKLGRNTKIPWNRILVLIPFVLVYMAAMYSYFVHFTLWSSLVVAPCLMVIGLSVSHDAIHFSLSQYPWVNEIFGYLTSAPFIYNAMLWNVQHNILHHAHTNEKEDTDIHIIPQSVGRVSTLFNKGLYKHVGPVIIGSLMVLATFLMTFNRPFEMVKPDSLIYNNLPHGFVKRHILLGSMSYLSSLCALLYPLLSNPLSVYTVVKTLLPWVTGSIYFSAITQVSHVTESAQAPVPQSAKWAEKQVAHSLDYSEDSWVCNFFSGGLNAQGLHHLVPYVHSAHLLALYPEYKEICARHGVRRNSAPSFMAALHAWIRWVCVINE